MTKNEYYWCNKMDCFVALIYDINKKPSAFFYVSREDEWLLDKYKFHLGDNNYVLTGYCKRIHRLIMGDNEQKLLVDHKNGNPLDNRRENLRFVTKSHNCFNRKKNKNNKSGITGVSWQVASQKWVAFIAVNKKGITLGRFDKIEDAVEARKAAEIKYFGENPPAREIYGSQNISSN